MREIQTSEIEQAVADEAGQCACVYPDDILQALNQAGKEETDTRSQLVMNMLKENAEIAEKEQIPICQDTGMAIVWLKIGQDVHLAGKDLNEAVNDGIRKGYLEHHLRASVVKDPLFERVNTKDNTPGIVHVQIVPGEQIQMDFMAKGFGAENMSRTAMLKPSDGLEGVRRFVLETIRKAGPNACPPMIVGVGIGGSFDSCAEMSKHALLRPLNQIHPQPEYAQLEKQLEEEASQLKIGPMGLGGKTTALRVLIEQAPTHIASLPVAVNICCHACRHIRKVI